MAAEPTDAQRLMLASIARLMETFGPDYWKALEDREAYPEEFVKEFEALGFGALLVPKEHGGSGGALSDAALVLEEIHARGGNAQPFHGQYYLSFLVSRFASPELRRRTLEPLARGALRMQSFALTEAEAGSDTARIRTAAKRTADGYVLSGRKMFVSRVEQSDLMVVAARTSPLDETAGRTKGLSLFLIDLRQTEGIERHRVRTMFNSQTYEVFFNDVRVPRDALIGEEGRGFEYLLHVLNPERILIASECLGDARWFIDRSREYASARVVFGKPIGSYQGVQFPIARAYGELVAADLVRWEAVRRYEAEANPKEVGKYANLAKFLASECSWHAGNVAMDVHGGYGMTRDLHIERKLRETRLYQVAPVANNLVLAYVAHAVLGLPRSY